MSIPKLSDFSNRELTMLSLAVGDKLITCSNNLETLSKFDESEFKDEQVKYWTEQEDIYRLWAAQIMNAHVEVKKNELATLN